MPLYTSESFSF